MRFQLPGFGLCPLGLYLDVESSRICQEAQMMTSSFTAQCLIQDFERSGETLPISRTMSSINTIAL